jgi:hypothetical protein
MILFPSPPLSLSLSLFFSSFFSFLQRYKASFALSLTVGSIL